MLEFSSISVSSYDAASLADKLTEKSGDGWNVVAVVAAGTNVTAYLSRERSQSTTDTSTRDDVVPTDASAYGTSAAEEAAAASREPAFEPVLPSSSTTSTAASAPAVEEPAGWAVEPEPAASTSASDASTAWTTGATATEPESYGASTTEPQRTAEQSYADTQSGSSTSYGDQSGSQPASTSYGDQSGSSTSTSYGDQSASQAASTGAGQAAASGGASSASSTATAPAGWYADPSGRYELRYWDGTQWTEHVSRAGQQYTDPPVA